MESFLSFTSAVLNVVAFVLLLLVTLSGYAIKGIYLVILPWVTDDGHDLRFGVLGFCQTDYRIETISTCFGPQRGYFVPFDLVEQDDLPLSVTDMMDPPLLSVLVLHPICAALSMLCAILALLSVFKFSPRSKHLLARFAFSLAFQNALLATAAFAIDVAVVEIAKSRFQDNVIIPYGGSAPWIALAAMILIWVSLIILGVRVFKYRGNVVTTKPTQY